MADRFEGRSGGSAAEGTPARQTDAPTARSGRGLSPADSLSQAVTGLSQGMNSLVRGHLALARVEMTHDLKAMGKNAAMELSGVPVLLTGYLLLWMAIGFLLALGLPAWGSFFICAGANFLIGAILIALGRERMRKERPPLRATTTEVRRDREWINTLTKSFEAEHGRLH